jgi:hypothetical protein
MSVDSTPDDQQPEPGGKPGSRVSRIPYDPLGEIEEAADPLGDTMDDYESDLRPVASKPRDPAETEILEEILRRVQRIEELLEKGDPQVRPPWAGS